MRTLPRRPAAEGSGSGVSVLGGPGGAGPHRPPRPALRSPGGCSPLEGGGERQAGAEAGLARPPPLAFPLPPAGSVPAARPGVGPGRLGAPHRRARGRAACAGRMWGPYRERDTLPWLPDTCCVITARSRGGPPKANGGCVPLPERRPGAAAQSGDSAFGSFSPAVSRSRNFLRCGGAGLGRGDPAPGESRTPRAVFICRKEG